jgi:uncharacterized protein YndB with AHSA1/START domain
MKEAVMADMHHLIQLEGDGASAYAALTTRDGITSWWTSRAEVPGAAVGDVLRMSFPDAPMTWDMRVDRSDPPTRVEWHCVGGPPGWDGTDVTWDIESTGDHALVRLDHTGFAEVDDMFRTVTVGWSQMLLCLKAYVETGVRAPFFDF